METIPESSVFKPFFSGKKVVGKTAIPEAFKKRRIDMGFRSVRALATAARVSHSLVSELERGRDRKLGESYLKQLCEALNVRCESGESVSKNGEFLRCNLWYGAHYTYDDDGQRVLKRTIWTFDERLYCKQEHEQSTLLYEGNTHFEYDRYFILRMTAKSGQLAEEATWRFILPTSDEPKLIKGHWFGADFEKRTASSKTLLSRERLSEGDVREALKTIKDSHIDVPTSERYQIVADQPWNQTQIQEDIMKIKDGEQIDLMSFFFPEIYHVLEGFSALVRDKKKATIRVLIVDPGREGRKLLEARYRLRDGDLQTYKETIRGQIKLFEDFKEKSRPLLNIEILKFTAWPMGHYFRIGTRAMYCGLFLAARSAVLGPMLSIRKDTYYWEELEDEFDRVWEDRKMVSGK